MKIIVGIIIAGIVYNVLFHSYPLKTRKDNPKDFPNPKV